MRWLRSIWTSRLVVALLVASLLPMVVVPTAQAVQRASTLTYANWLRSQLAAPAGEAFEQSLQAAVETVEAASMDAFLSAFVSAYEQQDPEAGLAGLFGVHDDLSDEDLLLYLRARFNRLVESVSLPPTTFIVGQAVTGKVSSRAAVLVVVPAAARLSYRGASAVVYGLDAQAFVLPLRVRCAARPLGP